MNYTKSIRQAIKFIEENLQSNVRTFDIAEDAGFSLYHFHRIFLAFVGTTPADYIRRRRLTQAAVSLLETDEEIIQIAFDNCFETQESFTRAFKKLFGTTPAKYRRRQTPDVYQYQFKIEILTETKGDLEMKPKIVEKEEFKVVGLSKNYVFKQPNDIPELWAEFNRREHEIKNSKSDGTAYGVCVQTGDGDEFEYVACVETTDFDSVPAGMTTKVIPARKYAVFTAEGVQNLQPTFQYIYGTWAEETDYKLAKSPDFEFYDERFDPENPLEGEIDIYIPIEKT